MNSANQPSETPSKFSAYKSYCQPSEMSETEVTSSILKGHESMMTVLANRGRQLEIVYKLWQSKDAKTGWTTLSFILNKVKILNFTFKLLTILYR